jgi:hypothetical protein
LRPTASGAPCVFRRLRRALPASNPAAFGEPELISPVLDGDTAHAALVAAPSKSDLDRREINRRAVKYWSTIRPMLVDLRGFSMIRHLGPDYVSTANGRMRGQEGPRVAMLRGPSPFEDGGSVGAWYDLESGKSGADAISLVEALGACDRKTATTFLNDLTDRLVEIAK